MAVTENWYPISAATHDLPFDAWTNNGGANKNASTQVGGGRAGPATHDDDTTYINSTAAIGHQSLNIDWPGPMSVWEGVLHANIRHRSTGGAVHRQAYFANGGGTLGTAWMDVTDASTSYASTGPVDVSAGATYKPGGTAWVASDFATDAVIFADAYNADAGGDVRVTSIWGDISYAPASGGFAFLLGMAGLGALPLFGAMDLSHFMRYLSWRRRYHPRHTILTGDSVRQAWDEIRAYRHPTFFMPRFA